MADFQTKVNMYNPLGVPGAFAAINPIVSTALGRTAKVDCPIGGFVWDVEDEAGKVQPTGEGKPLGFVARDVIYTIKDVAAGDQDFVPAGCAVNVQMKGDFYVKAPASVKVGDEVQVDASTGLVAESGEETGYVYASAGEADEIVIISNC